MTQRERDRLVALKKADKKLITQKQAAQQLGLSERQVRRLLAKLRSQGDRAVIHGARDRCSNRKISAKVEKQAIAILSRPEYAGFGPTLAAEYLQQRHGIHLGRETLRGWMAAAGLWKPRRRKPGRAHLWRPRRRCRGELVLRRCLTRPESKDAEKNAAAAEKAPRPVPRRKGSDWMKNFDLKKGPSVWQAAQASGARREEVHADALS